MAHSQANHNAAFCHSPIHRLGLVGPSFPSGPLSWPVTTHRCHHRHPSPLLVSAFLCSVKLLEIVCVGVCRLFLCVIQWTIRDSTKLESRPRPICLAPEANTTTVSVQAEEMKGCTYFYCCMYVCECVCGGNMSVPMPALQSYGDGGF